MFWAQTNSDRQIYALYVAQGLIPGENIKKINHLN